MHHIKLTPRTRRNRAHDVELAKDLLVALEEEAKKAIHSLKVLNTSKDKDVDALLAVGQKFSRDLGKASYDLRKVGIKSLGYPKAIPVFNKAIQKINESIRSINAPDENASSMKSKLEKCLHEIVPVGKDLFELVKKGDDKNHNGDVVDVIFYLAMITERITLRIKYHNANYDAIIFLIDQFEDEKVSALYGIEIDNPYMVRNLKHFANYGIKGVLAFVEDMHKRAALVNDENVRNTLLKSSYTASDAMHYLDKLFRDFENLKFIQDAIKVCNATMCVIMKDQITALKNCPIVGRDTHNAMLDACTHILSIGYALPRGYKHVSKIQKK